LKGIDLGLLASTITAISYATEKVTRKLSQNSKCPGRYSNWVLPEYKMEVLITRSQYKESGSLIA